MVVEYMILGDFPNALRSFGALDAGVDALAVEIPKKFRDKLLVRKIHHKRGRAEMLRLSGRYAEALAFMEEAFSEYPHRHGVPSMRTARAIAEIQETLNSARPHLQTFLCTEQDPQINDQLHNDAIVIRARPAQLFRLFSIRGWVRDEVRNEIDSRCPEIHLAQAGKEHNYGASSRLPGYSKQKRASLCTAQRSRSNSQQGELTSLLALYLHVLMSDVEAAFLGNIQSGVKQFSPHVENCLCFLQTDSR